MTAVLVGVTVASQAATAVPEAQAQVPRALRFGGLERTYVLHLPPGPPTGLVLNLHGAGMNGGQQQAATGYDGVADRLGLAVAYPDGIDLSWADGRGASTPDRQGVDDVGFLVTLVDQLATEYGIDRRRVFATGMSAGGFMVNRLACQRADVFSAVVPVAATLGTGVPCAPSQPVSVLQVHGTADPVVPFDGGPMVGRGGPSVIEAAPALAQRWRDLDGCPPPTTQGDGPGVTRFTSAGCAGGTEVSFVRVEGGGHTWPVGAFDPTPVGAEFLAAHGR